MTHIKGQWEVIRVGNITIAQGYKCSCGVVGCQQPNVPEPQQVQQLRTLIALDFHAGEQ